MSISSKLAAPLGLRAKVELAVAAVLLAAIAALSTYSWYLHTTKAKAKGEVSLQSARAEAGAVYSAGAKALIHDKEQSDAQIREVIRSNPVWADEPLPDDAAALLRHPSGSARAVP